LTGIKSAAAAGAIMPAYSEATEVVMNRATARAIARPATPAHEAAEIWTMAMWLLALVFLLTTLRVF